MGICDSSNTQFIDPTKIKKQSAVLGINPININELENLYYNELAICKIKEGNLLKGIGNFCKFENGLPFDKALFTSYNVLYGRKSNSDNSIEIEYLNQLKKIKLDNRRIVFNNTIGYICIEILDTDQVQQFFSIDEEIYDNEIFVLQYNHEEKLSHSVGVLDEPENNIIKYISDTKILYPGAPLIRRDYTNYVIGIHLKENKELEYNFENFGIPFKIIIKDIKDKLNINKNTLKEIQAFKYRNIINIVYEKKSEYEDGNNIFGFQFVNNNKNNIRLIINGKESELTKNYELKEGINNVKLIILKKLTNLNFMFNTCVSLKNIEELKYLYTEEITDCKGMFHNCESLTDANGLENFNVSKCKSFNGMFAYCKSLSDIKALRNWDVSNVNNFENMFSGCNSLFDIMALKNWKVSKGNDFSDMFSCCSSLENLKPLINWDVSNVKNFNSMFCLCKNLSNLKGLENWNVSKGTDFSSMFKFCSSIKDLNPLKKWDVSKAETFESMFERCYSITNLDGLENWNVSNVYNFSDMFNNCISLKDVNPLKNWDVINGDDFMGIFRECHSKLDITAVSFWILKDNTEITTFYM